MLPPHGAWVIKAKSKLIMKSFSIAHMLETPLEGVTSHSPYWARLSPLKDDNAQYNDGNDEDYHQYGTHKHSCKQKVYVLAVSVIIIMMSLMICQRHH